MASLTRRLGGAIERVRSLAEEQRRASVDGEWSFVEAGGSLQGQQAQALIGIGGRGQSCRGRHDWIAGGDSSEVDVEPLPIRGIRTT